MVFMTLRGWTQKAKLHLRVLVVVLKNSKCVQQGFFFLLEKLNCAQEAKLLQSRNQVVVFKIPSCNYKGEWYFGGFVSLRKLDFLQEAKLYTRH